MGSLMIELAGANWLLPHMNGSFKKEMLSRLEECFYEYSGYRDDGTGTGTFQAQIHADNKDAPASALGDTPLPTLVRGVFGDIMFNVTCCGHESKDVATNLYEAYELNRIINEYVVKREERLQTKDLYSRQEAKDNEIHTPLDELASGATDKIINFGKACDADSSFFNGTFFQGLCHGDLNWRNILKDQYDKIWIIDFPDAEVRPALHDLAKALSTVMFELTCALRDKPSLLDAACSISEAIASATSLEDPLVLDSQLPAELEPTWVIVQSLWTCCTKYTGRSDTSSTVQLFVPLLAYAIKIQCWIQYSPVQRKWALRSALLYIEALERQPHNASALSSPAKKLRKSKINARWMTDMEDDMPYTIKMYCTYERLRSAYVVDPITQQATNILDNFVPLRVLEGADKADLLRQEIDLDKQAEREVCVFVCVLACVYKFVSRTPC